MKRHPAALVPAKEAARELLKIAKHLRLFVDSTAQPVMPDGVRTISTFPPDQTEDFPVSTNYNDRTITIPDLFVDFHDWYYFAAQTIQGMPKTEIHWLRLTITATYDTSKAVGTYPPEAGVSTPVFEWTPDVPSLPMCSPTTPVSTGTDYYFYIAQVTAGTVTAVRSSRFIFGAPSEVPNPP
jgi:hypothetical protein